MPRLYLVHGVEKLGELIETLPVLAGVLLALHYGFSKLLDVVHPDLLKHCLALQTILRHWGEKTRSRSSSLCEKAHLKPHLTILILKDLYFLPITTTLQHIYCWGTKISDHASKLTQLLIVNNVVSSRLMIRWLIVAALLITVNGMSTNLFLYASTQPGICEDWLRVSNWNKKVL